MFGYHRQVEGEKSIDDQLLDLALMTNYSQSTFTWTVASSLSIFAQIQYCPGWSCNIKGKDNALYIRG